MRVIIFTVLVALCLGQTPKRPEDLPLKTADFRPSPPKKESLKNGVSFYILPQKGSPLVEVVLLFRGGAVFDPKGKSGLAYLATQTLLTCGAGRWNPQDFRNAVESLGGKIECDVGRDYVMVRLWVLPEEFEKGLELLGAVLLKPHFEKTAMEEKRRSLTTSLRRWFEHSGNMARALALETLSPLRGKPIYGKPEEMATVKREDLLRWHKRFFVGANCIAGVAGCVTEKQIADLRALLGRLPLGERVRDVAFGWVERGISVLIVPRSGLEQVAMAVAWRAPLRRDPMRPVIEMVTYIMATRINLEVREKGLAYTSYATYKADVASFLAYARTRKEKAPEALSRLLRAARSIATHPPTKESLTYTKNFFLNSFPHRFATCYTNLIQWMVAELQGLGEDYLSNYIGKVSEADITEFAVVGRSCAPLKEMVVVLVGDEESCRAAAAKLENPNITLIGGGK